MIDILIALAVRLNQLALLILGVMIFAIITQLYKFLAARRIMSLMEGKNIRKISDLKLGEYARITAQVLSDNNHTSMIAKHPCAWFSSKAQVIKIKRWTTVQDNRSKDVILVQDESGTINVSPFLKHVSLQKQVYIWKPNKGWNKTKSSIKQLFNFDYLPLYPHDEGKIEKHDKSSIMPWTNLIYLEDYLKKGDRVSIEGYVSKVNGQNTIIPKGLFKGAYIKFQDDEFKLLKEKAELHFVNMIIGLVFIAMVLYFTVLS